MKWTILSVDDEKFIHAIIQRALDPASYAFLSADNGEEGLRIARQKKPDLILLDINMPVLSGRDVLLEIRKNIVTRMIPVIFLTGGGNLDDVTLAFDLGADDYIRKPFDVDELQARVKGVLLRTQRNLSANPLTRLPGNPMIEEEVTRRIREKRPFAFFYVDIDNFKSYNDLYGYHKGDQVIQDVAALLLSAVIATGSPNDALGHVGGDDFVLVTDPARADAVAKAVAEGFDAKAPSYYSPEDSANGFITTKNRQGEECRFPIMTLSIAIASTLIQTLDHYGKVVTIAAAIKKHLKSQPNRRGSLYLIDRRGDSPPR